MIEAIIEEEDRNQEEDAPILNEHIYQDPINFGQYPSISKMIDGNLIAFTARNSLLQSSWDRVNSSTIPVL